MLYRHTLPDGGSALVRRMVVANHAELITAFCTACAESIGTHQVLCFQRNLAIGGASLRLDATDYTLI